MPYIILLIGLVLAVAGFYRFLLKADGKQVKTLFLSIAAIGVGLGSLILAVTGKLPAAIGILAALWPLGVSYIRQKQPSGNHRDAPLPTSRLEAYNILGLKDGASEDDIRSAHMRLMKKVHPDQQGSDWLAQKINAARDILLKP